SLSSLGLDVTTLPVTEFLFVLRPLQAALKTPNLQRWQRVSLGLAGILQRSGWPRLRFLKRRGNESGPRSKKGPCPLQKNGRLSFFQESSSAQWRFLPNQYERIAHGQDDQQYVVAKAGSAHRYLRVCQWRLDEGQPIDSLVAALIERAKDKRALGVRWAVYGESEASREPSQSMRRLGFLCARRERTILVYSKDAAFR